MLRTVTLSLAYSASITSITLQKISVCSLRTELLCSHPCTICEKHWVHDMSQQGFTAAQLCHKADTEAIRSPAIRSVSKLAVNTHKQRLFSLEPFSCLLPCFASRWCRPPQRIPRGDDDASKYLCGVDVFNDHFAVCRAPRVRL